MASRAEHDRRGDRVVRVEHPAGAAVIAVQRGGQHQPDRFLRADADAARAEHGLLAAAAEQERLARCGLDHVDDQRAEGIAVVTSRLDPGRDVRVAQHRVDAQQRGPHDLVRGDEDADADARIGVGLHRSRRRRGASSAHGVVQRLRPCVGGGQAGLVRGHE
jgi:hypothetical protein